MHPTKRYRADWYQKRINQNSKIKKHLIGIIETHKEKDFMWVKKDLISLNYEDLAEIAIACVNKRLHITLGSNQDYNDCSDVKFTISQHRNNIKLSPRTGKSHWQNSYSISGIEGKTGALRVIAYNTILNSFEYFYIPKNKFDNTKKRIEIVLETYTVAPGKIPKFNGRNENKVCKWYEFRCRDFAEMALANH